MNCPCESSRPFDTCCGPILDGGRKPRTAEELMRARFSAHCRGAIDFLVRTRTRALRTPTDAEQIRESLLTLRWQRLEVLSVEGGGPEDEEGRVRFAAHYEVDGLPGTHRELSSFRREDGEWVYVDAVEEGEVARRSSAPGRNDPCHCGSGRKFKKCCGR